MCYSLYLFLLLRTGVEIFLNIVMPKLTLMSTQPLLKWIQYFLGAKVGWSSGLGILFSSHAIGWNYVDPCIHILSSVNRIVLLRSVLWKWPCSDFILGIVRTIIFIITVFDITWNSDTSHLCRTCRGNN